MYQEQNFRMEQKRQTETASENEFANYINFFVTYEHMHALLSLRNLIFVRRPCPIFQCSAYLADY